MFPEFNYRRLCLLLTKYGDPDSAWAKFSAEDLRELGIRSANVSEFLAKRLKLDIISYEKKLAEQNIKTLEITTSDYPAILKEIYDPPLVLYQKGELPISALNGIAVVGTRNPSPYGIKATERIVEGLKPLGLPIVSGLALGIDAVAHGTALSCGLPTVAVLGTGLDRIYPYENRKIFTEIEKKGMLLSEYAPGTKPEPWNFPRRNRIITGLSRAVLVIEGDIKSGALISGKLALAQDREVYALPGPIFASTSTGPNWLISQGAQPLLGAEQLLADLLPGQQLALVKKNLPKEVFLSNEEKDIFKLIENNSYSLDDLLEGSKWPYARLIQTITALELKGVIAQLPGKRYIRA